MPIDEIGVAEAIDKSVILPSKVNRNESSVVSKWGNRVKSLIQRQAKKDLNIDKNDVLPLGPNPSRSGVDVLSGLSDRIYTDEYDAIAVVLDKIPSSEANEEVLSDWIMLEMSEIDLARDVVKRNLCEAVQENYTAFIQGMRQIKELDLDLSRAGIHVNNGRRKLQQAKEDLHEKMKLLQELRRKSRFQEIKKIALDCKYLLQQEKELSQAAKDGDYSIAIELALTCADGLEDETVSRIHALDAFKHRMKSSLVYLRTKVDKRLESILNGKFDAKVYESIIKAYLLLDTHGVTASTSRGNSATSKYEDASGYRNTGDGGISGLVNRVMSSIIGNLETSIATDMLTYILKEILPASKGAVNSLQQPTRTPSPLTDPLQKDIRHLLNEIPNDKIHNVFQKLFEIIVTFMHQYYLVCQWHRDPMAPDNSSDAYLHRCDINISMDELDFTLFVDEDEAIANGEEADIASNNNNGNSNNNNDKNIDNHNHDDNSLENDGDEDTGEIDDFESAMRATELLKDKRKKRERRMLHVVWRDLMQARKTLWDYIQRLVGEYLNAVMSLTKPSFKLSEWVKIYDVIELFIEFGWQFCEEEATDLTQILLSKMKEYFLHFHNQSFGLLRDTLEREQWMRIPVKLDVLGGLDGLLHRRRTWGDRRVSQRKKKTKWKESSSLTKRNRTTRTTRDQSMSVSAFRSSSVLSTHRHSSSNEYGSNTSYLAQFTTRGNPFAYDDGGDEINELDEYLDDNGGTGSDKLTSHHQEQEQKESESSSASTSKFGDYHNKHGEISVSDEGEEEMMYGSRFVITSTAINGFVKYVDKYMQLMEALRPISGEVFKGLTQLFEYYLYVVYVVALFSSHNSTNNTKSSTSSASSTAKNNNNNSSYTSASADKHYANEISISNSDRQSRVLLDSKSYTLLKTLLIRIRDDIVARETPTTLLPSPVNSSSSTPTGASTGGVMSSYTNNTQSILLPPRQLLSSMLDLDTSVLNGAEERSTAVESIFFLIEILHKVEPQVFQCIPKAFISFVTNFYERSGTVTKQLRSFIYSCIAEKLLEMNIGISQLIQKETWNIKAFQVEHHSFIDTVLRDMRNTWTSLNEISSLHSSSKDLIWSHLVSFVMQEFVDGISRVNKCSAEGRVAMAMDAQAMVEGLLQDIHPLKSADVIKNSSYIDAYIKAFYLTEEDLFTWIPSVLNDYSLENMKSIIKGNSGLVKKTSKKERKYLIEKIESLYHKVGSR